MRSFSRNSRPVKELWLFERGKVGLKGIVSARVLFGAVMDLQFQADFVYTLSHQSNVFGVNGMDRR